MARDISDPNTFTRSGRPAHGSKPNPFASIMEDFYKSRPSEDGGTAATGGQGMDYSQRNTLYGGPNATNSQQGGNQWVEPTADRRPPNPNSPNNSTFTSSDTGSGTGSTGGSTGTGMFNFDSIMKGFYDWKPKDDDVAGQALKNTFQGDFIQTVLNNQMSKDLAYTNAEIATGQMTQAAMLELANQTAIMADEHKYGQLKMGAEYEYQSKFATDEANRELTKLSHTADLQQNQTKLEGDQNRLNIDAQGRNDIKLQDQKNKGALDQINSQGNIDAKLQGIKGEQALEQLKESGINDQALQELKNSGALDQITEQGDVDKAIQSMKEKGQLDQIGAQGVEALKQIESQGYLDNQMQKLKGEQATDQIKAQGSVDKDLQGMKGDQAIGQINAQGALDNAMQQLKGKQATEQIGAQGNVDLSKIKETGNQEREGMKQATTEDTKKQKRDSGMARGLAGMF